MENVFGNRKYWAKKAIYIVAVTVISVLYILPVIWMSLSSFKPTKEIFQSPPRIIPDTVTLDQYINAFQSNNVGKHIFTTVVIAVFSMVFSLLIGSMMAYPLARKTRKGYGAIMAVVISGRMMPAAALCVPMYMIFRMLGLIDTHIGLIVCYTTFNLPFSVFLIRSFIRQVPYEIEESGKIDGCTKTGILFRLLLPLIAPGLATTAIFSFLLAWNDLLFAIILTTTEKVRTLSVLVTSYNASRERLYGEMYAVMTITLIPVVLLTIFAQKYLVEGLTAGSVKG
ncbi:ABC transporter permease subunit [Yeguia hominis]|uniref:Carbohydrate ABC transporter permease n=1 Tax=Yeguia hominis TaxID=2763662 RepID=A0A926HSP9_9FIRM|nr:carbohydrate ABC transporter permease [Yeguia hominis]